MAESIQQPFQRFQISDDDISTSLSSSTNEPQSIPILNRSKEAKAQSLKLQHVSPTCVIVVGMAGSGKTTLMAALQRSLNIGSINNGSDGDDGKSHVEESDHDDKHEDNDNDNDGIQGGDGGDNVNKGPLGYCLNLDPATKLVPFGASIDIRDTVDYKVGLIFSYDKEK